MEVQIWNLSLDVTSTIVTPLHGPLRAQSESSSILDSGPLTEILNSWGPEDCVNQLHLSAPIPAAQVNVTSGHNIYGKKRKLDAVEGDKGESPPFYVYTWS